jgi:cytochrome c oxidase assembly factor CtaG
MDFSLSSELVNLIRNGFIVTIVLMAVFYFIRFPETMNKNVKEILTKIILLSVSYLVVWLLNEIEGTKKQMIAYYLLTTSFSVLFYEFAGKYIVQKWFAKYLGENIKENKQ